VNLDCSQISKDLRAIEDDKRQMKDDKYEAFSWVSGEAAYLSFVLFVICHPE